jgi:hypothetical protein
MRSIFSSAILVVMALISVDAAAAPLAGQQLSAIHNAPPHTPAQTKHGQATHIEPTHIEAMYGWLNNPTPQNMWLSQSSSIGLI